MTHFEFEQAINRLKKTFPATQFGEERERLMFRAVASLPAENLNRIVDHFIATFRQAPLPKDFLEAAAKERIHLKPLRDQTPPPPPGCRLCLDSGIINVRYAKTRRDVFMNCNCGAQSVRDFPFWSREMESDFTLAPFSGRDWAPKQASDKSFTESLKEKVEEWKLKLQISHGFWNDYFSPQPEPPSVA